MRWKKRIIIPALLFFFIAVLCAGYVSDYYHTDENVQVYLQKKDSVSILEMPDGLYLDGPGDDAAGVYLEEPQGGTGEERIVLCQLPHPLPK